MPVSPRSDPKRIAYDLWCLQEDRRIAGQPLENLDALVRTLREQQPQLPDETLHQGVEHFLTWMLADAAGRLAGRHRCVLHAYRGALPARPQPPRRDRTGTPPDPGSDERWS